MTMARAAMPPKRESPAVVAGVSVQPGSEPVTPTKIRPFLKANAAMQSRLALLRWRYSLRKEKTLEPADAETRG